MDESEILALRAVSVSQGIMLETISDRLGARGGPHFGSPDKVPAVRLAMVDRAGQAGVPFTTGLLIGLGETRAERIEALLALRDLHERYGHIRRSSSGISAPNPARGWRLRPSRGWRTISGRSRSRV